MASCKLGHIYIVETVLTKPPKAKFALCVCLENGFFLWINSKPRPHGKDQMALDSGCHELVTKDCFLDLSRVVAHPNYELDDAREFPRIDAALASSIIECIDAGLFLMPKAHSAIVRGNLLKIL
jgi:hypothetical protein